jgi:hypothetical protein
MNSHRGVGEKKIFFFKKKKFFLREKFVKKGGASPASVGTPTKLYSI